MLKIKNLKWYSNIQSKSRYPFAPLVLIPRLFPVLETAAVSELHTNFHVFPT